MRITASILLLAGALAGCASAAQLGRGEMSATLTGYQQVPVPGDLDGTGTARLRVDAGDGRLCWELSARGIDPATAAHVHRGEAGTVGPPVVPLTTPDASERSEGCAAVDPALAREILAQPHRFYVNVHNAPFPTGAIRGQLRGQPRRAEPQRPPVRR